MPPAPRIESKRLLLDAFRNDDAEALFAYASLPSVAKWMSWEPHRNLDDTRSALQYLTADVPGQYEWAIRLRDGANLVGGISLIKTGDSSEIHFAVAEAHWNRGIATEAARLVLKWAWSAHPELSYIHTAPVAENVASRSVLERLGFVAGQTRRSGFHKFQGGILVIDYRLDRKRPNQSLQPNRL